MSFPNELIAEMSNHQAKFGKIIYLPNLALEQRCSEIDNVLEDIHCNEYMQESLQKTWPPIKRLVELMDDETEAHHDEIYNELANNEEGFNFLVEVLVRVPTRFRFNDDGKFCSYTYYDGGTELHYIIAKNMNDACVQAIALGKERFDAHLKRTKEEQE